MGSMYYQSKANSANNSITEASTSLTDSIATINDLLLKIPNNDGYDALGRNSYESLDGVKDEINKTNSFDSIKQSITSKAILLDQEIDRRNEEDNGDTNKE